jgi:hypothetical protein
MKNISLVLWVIVIVLFSCSEKSLTEEEAGSLISERVSKMKGRAVPLYLGAMTDPEYARVYRAISTGKYLTINDNVYVEAAKKKMSVVEATDEGKEIFECERNRCTVELCKYKFGGILVLSRKGRFASARYRLISECEGELYEMFKPLADKLFVRPDETEETVEFELVDNNWKIK